MNTKRPERSSAPACDVDAKAVRLRCLLVVEHVRAAVGAFRAGGHGYAGVFEIAGGEVCSLDEAWGEQPPADIGESVRSAANRVSDTREPVVSSTSDGSVVAGHPIWLYDGGRYGRLVGCFVLVPPPSLRSNSDWASAIAKFAADQMSERVSSILALMVERGRHDHAEPKPAVNAGELAHYKRLVDLSTDLMLMANRDRTLLAVNHSIAANLGYHDSELLGRDAVDFVREDERSAAIDITNHARSAGMAMGVFHLVRKDGSTVPAEVFVSYDRDAGVFCVIQRDVSDRLRMERELLERSRQLEDQNLQMKAAMEDKSRFFRNVSHELRTPVTSIIGFAELALDDAEHPPSPSQRLALERIADNARRLLEMLNDLLDLSKLEAGKAQLSLSEVSIRGCLEQAAENLRPLARDKNLTLSLDLPDNLPRLTTDEQKLNQIMANLISNALKFTSTGEVRVSARRNGRSVRIDVSDTGQGIPADELPHVFKEFYQGSRRTKGAKGTGLGLAIARKLAGLLGGDIEARSRVGEGSTFTVKLPLSLSGSGQAGE